MNELNKVSLIKKITEIENGLWNLKCDIDFDESAITINDQADDLIEQTKSLLHKIRKVTRTCRMQLLSETLNYQ